MTQRESGKRERVSADLTNKPKKPEGPTPRLARSSYLRVQYQTWVRNNRLRASDLARMRYEVSDFEVKPLISVLLPVCSPKQEWLERTMDSVMSQVYPCWELRVCDGGPTGNHAREVLSRYECLDERIKVSYEENAGIPGAASQAFAAAMGDFVGVLDQDSELAPNALFEVAGLLKERLDADLIYSDEDMIDDTGIRSDPSFKPGWSPDLLLAFNYVSRLSVYRKKLLEEIGGFRDGFGNSWDYDMVLRFTEKTGKIFHVPKVLYHVRSAEAHAPKEDRRALAEALKRRGIEGSVVDGASSGHFRVKRKIESNPKVSIVIPTRDNVSLLKSCVESIERLTDYRNYEVLIVDNDSADPETEEYLSSTPHRVLRFEEDFNYSRINNFAVSHSEGEYILLLNDDTEVISRKWLTVMLEHAQRPGVGAVGAKLLYPDGHIQHAGVLLGLGNPWTAGVAGHAYQAYASRSPGHLGTLKSTCNYSAVTAACMMFRRTVFDEIGGFDEKNLEVAYNDVDLCLRVRERGYLIVFTPCAELYHHEFASRGLYSAKPSELRYMRERWGELLDNDPYYNPNFSLVGDFNLRADMLRPKALRDKGSRKNSENTLVHPEVIGREEFQSFVRRQQKNARNSRRVNLVPVLS